MSRKGYLAAMMFVCSCCRVLSAAESVSSAFWPTLEEKVLKRGIGNMLCGDQPGVSFDSFKAFQMRVSHESRGQRLSERMCAGATTLIIGFFTMLMARFTVNEWISAGHDSLLIRQALLKTGLTSLLSLATYLWAKDAIKLEDAWMDAAVKEAEKSCPSCLLSLIKTPAEQDSKNKALLVGIKSVLNARTHAGLCPKHQKMVTIEKLKEWHAAILPHLR